MIEPRGIIVRYIYSACVVTHTPDLRLLHDPWFTDGIYDGSWFQFPEVPDPFERIGDVDMIYVSHIHPDHYDGGFLKRYFARFGVKPVLIADHKPNHLAGKMRADGIAPTILEADLVLGRTRVRIVPHRTGHVYDIDSALVLHYEDEAGRTHCVVNANDIIFDVGMRDRLKVAAGEIDILLCGYTGAGPYPQTYFDLDDPRLPGAAAAKKQAFFERYRSLTGHMAAKVNIPFAGQYLLGGKLAPLNAMRGVADAAEVLAFDPRAVVLADVGGEIGTVDLVPTATRTKPYESAAMARRVAVIDGAKMKYERLIDAGEVDQLPLRRLLAMAYKKAIGLSNCGEDYFFCIALPNGRSAMLNANRNVADGLCFLDPGAELPEPHSEIRVDPRYLFGLLTHIYHWNSAEVGSQYETRRSPDILNRAAQAFLNFLAV